MHPHPISFRVHRTCTEAVSHDGQESHTLAYFCNRPAYVLLGEPGAGKTTAFEMEREACDGEFVSARDFVSLSPRPEWRIKTLFIDGLDEMRAGKNDGHTALDAIRRRLEELGRPRFRLTCREADWLGANDSEDLRSISPDGQISVLHLDDLNDGQVLAILSHDTEVKSAEDFLRQAKDRGLSELLYNPITLKLLIAATGGKHWPASRNETYAMASRSLCQERNKRHRDAVRFFTSSIEEMLRAASRLFAIQLLAGISGFALDNDAEDEQHVGLEALDLELSSPLQQALKTRLFMAGDQEERRKPMHRSVAEYLGARYLADLIENQGLPLGRILALMTGEDGGVVASLRGLHAWLAVHCVSGRRALIDRDPLGVVLYGDALRFSQQDKLHLLDALQRESIRYPWFRFSNWTSSPFAALGTEDMAETFLGHLQSSERSDAHQSLLDCILDALFHGLPLPTLAAPLMAVVCDTSYQLAIRSSALRAHIHATQGEPTSLLLLLNDIRSGVTEDANDDLLGQLLHHLYPQHLTPSQVTDYLHIPQQTNLVGLYSFFWHDKIFEKTSTEDIPALLDAFIQHEDQLGHEITEFHFKRYRNELLARTIEAHGEKASSARLFDWLGVGLGKYNSPILEREHAQRIASWLTAHPDSYQCLILHCAERCTYAEDFASCMFDQYTRFYDAIPPEGMANWCLQQAESAEKDDFAKYFFEMAIRTLLATEGYNVLLVESLTSWVKNQRPQFEAWLSPWLRCEMDDWRHRRALRERQHETETKTRQTEWNSFIYSQLDAIRDGTAAQQTLDNLVMVYLGLYNEAHGKTPRDRFLNFFGDGGDALIDVAVSGFRQTLARSDLPTIREIVDLDLKKKCHFIRAPCLAGMNELFLNAPATILSLSDDVLSKAVAFWLTDGVGNTPSWFTLLVRERPQLTAAILIIYTCAMLKAGREHITELHALAHDDDYRSVAIIAVPQILQALPSRMKKAQHNALTILLKAGLRHLDDTSMLGIIGRKLKLLSMDKTQQTLWLVTGLMITPNCYGEQARQLIGTRKARIATLASFFHGLRDDWNLPPTVPETTIELLIELLGPTCNPKRPTGAYSVTAAIRTADFVRSLVNRLGSHPSRKASEVLKRLAFASPLSAWHRELRHALQTQNIARRHASFSHPAVRDIVLTLKNRQPANQADLAALVLDHLRDIAYRLRHGDTNGYQSFWKGAKPAIENYCRDRLLDLLRPRLAPLAVEAQKEGYYAQDKRADIRVSYPGGGFNLPIEIKRNTHDNLWLAMHDQLMASYTPDPDSSGFGIYLIFWFSNKGMPMPPSGSRPKNAVELETQLVELLSEDERRRISVCVIDCSLPQHKGTNHEIPTRA